MGNTRDALRLIMRQQKDIDQAIEFCKTYDDSELWEQLIGYSLAKPGTTITFIVKTVLIKLYINILDDAEFVNVLLRNIGTHVDPRLLVERIEYGMQVPGLRDSLVKILHDYNLQVIQFLISWLSRLIFTIIISICRFLCKKRVKKF